MFQEVKESIPFKIYYDKDQLMFGLIKNQGNNQFFHDILKRNKALGLEEHNRSDILISKKKTSHGKAKIPLCSF